MTPQARDDETCIGIANGYVQLYFGSIFITQLQRKLLPHGSTLEAGKYVSYFFPVNEGTGEKKLRKRRNEERTEEKN